MTHHDRELRDLLSQAQQLTHEGKADLVAAIKAAIKKSYALEANRAPINDGTPDPRYTMSPAR